jgi:threonine dehydrogenase-like Zn-dependent dehydrogenase
MGRNSVEVVEVPDPTILDDRDAVVRVTSTAICGSDLHLYDGYVPEMKRGDVLGHEFMGEVVETGKGVGNLQVGDRVVVPFPIACGGCTQCRNGMTSICENSNPNAGMAEKLWGRATSGIFGYSHLTGGYAGGQAEFVRVPFADVGPMKVPSHLSDEQVLFLTDIFPTGYMGAELCDITEGDTIAVWGAGPGRPVRRRERLPARRPPRHRHRPLRLPARRRARQHARRDAQLRAGRRARRPAGDDRRTRSGRRHRRRRARGPPRQRAAALLRPGQAGHAGRDRARRGLRQAILACRNGGIVSVVGVYGGLMDKFPIGSLMNRSITLRGGQTHVHRYQHQLLERIEQGQIDPSFIITHRASLAEAPEMYETFKNKRDDCLKVVLTP